jgi:hypothetical protein
MNLLKEANLYLQISEARRDLAETFSPNKAWGLPPHRDDDLAIDLESGAELSLKPIDRLSALEMETLSALISGTPYPRIHGPFEGRDRCSNSGYTEEEEWRITN